MPNIIFAPSIPHLTFISAEHTTPSIYVRLT